MEKARRVRGRVGVRLSSSWMAEPATAADAVASAAVAWRESAGGQPAPVPRRRADPGPGQREQTGTAGRTMMGSGRGVRGLVTTLNRKRASAEVGVG